MLTEIKELITVTKMGPIIINLDSKIQEIIFINLQIKLMVTKMGKIIINLNIRIKQIIVIL